MEIIKINLVSQLSFAELSSKQINYYSYNYNSIIFKSIMQLLFNQRD